MHQPAPTLAWYDVADPASPDLDQLARQFNLHELDIEDCRHAPQRAKEEEHDTYVFSILKRIHTKPAFKFRDFCMFLGRDFLITVHTGESDLIAHVAKKVAEEKVTRLDRIFYFLTDAIVDEYLPVLDAISEKISDIESAVLERPEPKVLRQIFDFKRQLIYFRRATSEMRELVNAVLRRENGIVNDDLDHYFRDVYDHLVRTLDLIETNRDLVTGSLDIYLSAVANRTNEVMKVLTVWGTVALPLVIITGFFGMNLHLPWMQDPHGAWYATALMIASTVGILIYFRRKGWF
ncbi:MAG: magnesium/cobalt transporter CorA [Terriglobales bacterium]|jgi:magnesium transporter